MESLTEDQDNLRDQLKPLLKIASELDQIRISKNISISPGLH